MGGEGGAKVPSAIPESDVQRFPAMFLYIGCVDSLSHCVSYVFSVSCLILCLACDKYNDEVTGLDCK